MESHFKYSLVDDFFHEILYVQDFIMLLHRESVYSFSLICNIQFYERIANRIYILFLMDIYLSGVQIRAIINFTETNILIFLNIYSAFFFSFPKDHICQFLNPESLSVCFYYLMFHLAFIQLLLLTLCLVAFA